MNELKKELEGMSEVFLSDGIKIVIGDKSAVIYDFLEGRAYRINKNIAKALQQSVLVSVEEVKTSLLQATGNRESAAFSTIEGFLSTLKEKGILNRCLDKRGSEEKIIKTKENPTLKHCAIETTLNCNFFCPHCYIGERKDSNDLSLSILPFIFNQLTLLKVPELHLTGGEFFLREDAEGILDLLKDYNFNVRIVSNGSLIKNHMVNLLKELGVSIQISVYGFSDEVCRNYTNKSGILQTIMATIFNLQKVDIKLILAYTVMRQNEKDLERFVNFCEENEIDYRIAGVLPIGRAKRNRSDLILSENRKTEIENKYLGNNRPIIFKTHSCDLSRMCILSNGDISPCLMLRNSEYMMGNVMKNTLASIWHSDRFSFFRKRLDIEEREPCKNCEIKYICGGACPAISDSVFSSGSKTPVRYSKGKCQFYPGKGFLEYCEI